MKVGALCIKKGVPILTHPPFDIINSLNSIQRADRFTATYTTDSFGKHIGNRQHFHLFAFLCIRDRVGKDHFSQSRLVYTCRSRVGHNGMTGDGTHGLAPFSSIRLAAFVMVPAVSTISSIKRTSKPSTSPIIRISATSLARRRDLWQIPSVNPDIWNNCWHV